MTNLLIITILSQWLIAIVFLATGVPKALDNPGFARLFGPTNWFQLHGRGLLRGVSALRNSQSGSC